MNLDFILIIMEYYWIIFSLIRCIYNFFYKNFFNKGILLSKDVIRFKVDIFVMKGLNLRYVLIFVRLCILYSLF